MVCLINNWVFIIGVIQDSCLFNINNNRAEEQLSIKNNLYSLLSITISVNDQNTLNCCLILLFISFYDLPYFLYPIHATIYTINPPSHISSFLIPTTKSLKITNHIKSSQIDIILIIQSKITFISSNISQLSVSIINKYQSIHFYNIFIQINQDMYYTTPFSYQPIYYPILYYPNTITSTFNQTQIYQQKTQESPVKSPIRTSKFKVADIRQQILEDQFSSQYLAEQRRESSKKKDAVYQNEKNLDKKKKNIRNIIPNIARKIVTYMSSSQSRQILLKLFPNLSTSEISKFKQFANSLKQKLTVYIGNKDMHRIWFRETKSPRQKEFLRMIRILSKHFLNNGCISSILLSKRMKESLKEEHLRYRRKMLTILKNGFKQDFNIMDV